MYPLSVSSINTFRICNKLCTRYLVITNKYANTPDSEQTRTFSESKNNYDDVVDKNSKLIMTTVKSLRADMLLKAGLGLARNKIDPLFYESKILLNGENMSKKSILLKEGDEIDVVKGVSDKNPNYITVARVEVLETNEKENNIQVKLRICKNLTVDDSDKS